MGHSRSSINGSPFASHPTDPAHLCKDQKYEAGWRIPVIQDMKSGEVSVCVVGMSGPSFQSSGPSMALMSPRTSARPLYSKVGRPSALQFISSQPQIVSNPLSLNPSCYSTTIVCFFQTNWKLEDVDKKKLENRDTKNFRKFMALVWAVLHLTGFQHIGYSLFPQCLFIVPSVFTVLVSD